MAQSGFADSLELAVSSLGYEARLHLREKRFREALELLPGNKRIRVILRPFFHCALLPGGLWSRVHRPSTDWPKDPKARKVITAYVIDAGMDLHPIDIDIFVKESMLNAMQKASAKTPLVPAPKPTWHRFRHPVQLWLQAVESPGSRMWKPLSNWRWPAYQIGDPVTAQRWLDRALSTPVAQWCGPNSFCARARWMRRSVAGASVPALPHCLHD